MDKLLGLPVVASEHGKQVDALIVYVHWLMIALFVGWLAYFAFVLFRFRKSRNPRADYVGVRSHASSWVEGAVAIVEAVLLIGFAIPLWAKVVDTLPDENNSTVMRVIAQQFGWNARYPGPDKQFGAQDFRLVTSTNMWGIDPNDATGKDDITVLNEIHVPVNKPVIIHLSSKDVIHSLKIIALRITQDAIPGMSIPVTFQATQTGRYQINCAQLCGNGHYSMSLGFITVETQEAFDQWYAQQSKGGGATNFE